MNKHGFTLVELLAVIVIIALIGGIGVVSYTGLINQTTRKAFETYQDNMHAQAAYYLTEHYNDVSFNSSGYAQLSLSVLGMDPINNPKDKNNLCPDSYVGVTKGHDSVSGVLSITYNVCLKCGSDFDECKEYIN